MRLREEKTIVVPSGETAGVSESRLAAVSLVRSVRLVPSVLTFQMLNDPAALPLLLPLSAVFDEK